MLECSKVLLKFIQCQWTRSVLVPTHFLCVYSFPRNSEFSAGKVFSVNRPPLEGTGARSSLAAQARAPMQGPQPWPAPVAAPALLAGHWQSHTALTLVSKNIFSSLKFSQQLIPPVLPVTLQSQKLVLPAGKARCLLKKFVVVLAQEVSVDIMGITKAISSLLSVNKWLDYLHNLYFGFNFHAYASPHCSPSLKSEGVGLSFPDSAPNSIDSCSTMHIQELFAMKYVITAASSHRPQPLPLLWSRRKTRFHSTEGETPRAAAPSPHLKSWE